MTVMNILPTDPVVPTTQVKSPAAPPTPLNSQTPAEKAELRKAFDDFVGQTFFGQLLQTMRKSVGKPAYFHGGRAEEVFQTQLDQVLVEEISAASADKLTGPMFDLFTLPRR